MSAKILDGNALAKGLKKQMKQEVAALKDHTGRVPHLVNVMIGEDPGSCSYANSQMRVAGQVGIKYELRNLANDISQSELIENIHALNQDSLIDGIMIHKPVPAHIHYRNAANCLNTEKDVEGINVANVGRMMLGTSRMIPCTPAAVMEHIKSTGVGLRGKELVIVGASEIVGKPLSLLLLREMATVTICHIGTSEADRLEEHVRRAQILIVAAGKAELIKGDWISEGTVVIDVGINEVNGKIVGDVEFAVAQEKASYITPVPGGVGPVTVVMLMRNGIEAYRLQLEKHSVQN